MTIPLLGAGGLYTRLGKVGHAFNQVNVFRGGTLPTVTTAAVETVDGDGDDKVRQTLTPLLGALNQQQQSMSSYPESTRTAFVDLLLKMVFDDDPRPSATSVEQCIRELIRQMQASAHWVTPNVLGSTVTQTNLDGNGTVVVSLTDAFGRPLENIIAEDIECVVTSTAAAGSESVTVAGEDTDANKLGYDWPAKRGSGAAQILTVLDPLTSTDTRITDGSFENWAAGALTDWEAVVGTYATDWVQEATEVHAGINSLRLVPDGIAKNQLRQDISAEVDGLGIYAGTVWLRNHVSQPAAGEIRISLDDGTGPIKDMEGNDLGIVIDLTALIASTWTPFSFSFALPEPLPPLVYFQILESISVTSGQDVLIDSATMGPMTELYPGGPLMAITAGDLPYSLQDYTGGGAAGDRVFKVAITNDRAGEWQELFDKMYDMAAMGLTLPTVGTTEIPDTLIS